MVFLNPVPSDHSDLIAKHVLSGSLLWIDWYILLAQYLPRLYSKIGPDKVSSTASSVGHAPVADDPVTWVLVTCFPSQ